MDALETLLAIEAIKQLKARYFYTLDTKQWHAYGALFTADAVIDFSSQQALMQQAGMLGAVAADEAWRCVGGAALAAWIEPLLSAVASVHHGHDPQITLTGADSASGIWAMYDRLETALDVFHGYGHYHETYRQIDGNWLFASLTLTRLQGVWHRRDLSAGAARALTFS